MAYLGVKLGTSHTRSYPRSYRSDQVETRTDSSTDICLGNGIAKYFMSVYRVDPAGVLEGSGLTIPLLFWGKKMMKF